MRQTTSLALAALRRRVAALERDEFRFALPVNQSPFVPAEAGTQFFGRMLGPWVPASAGTNGVQLSSSRPYVALALVWKFLWCSGSVPLPLVNARWSSAGS